MYGVGPSVANVTASGEEIVSALNNNTKPRVFLIRAIDGGAEHIRTDGSRFTVINNGEKIVFAEASKLTENELDELLKLYKDK